MAQGDRNEHSAGQVLSMSYDEDAAAVAVSQKTLLAGEDLTANVMKTEQRASYANITSDTVVKSGAGRFYGFIVNSHSSGTIKVWDNTAQSGTVLLNTITLGTGPQSWVFPIGIEFATGLAVDVGGTIDVTVLYK
jgi:hypothetical protein